MNSKDLKKINELVEALRDAKYLLEGNDDPVIIEGKKRGGRPVGASYFSIIRSAFVVYHEKIKAELKELGYEDKD